MFLGKGFSKPAKERTEWHLKMEAIKLARQEAQLALIKQKAEDAKEAAAAAATRRDRDEELEEARHEALVARYERQTARLTQDFEPEGEPSGEQQETGGDAIEEAVAYGIRGFLDGRSKKKTSGDRRTGGMESEEAPEARGPDE